MPLDLSDTLVVGFSATALFDLAEADAVFKAKYTHDPQTALAEYREYMLARENEPLGDGTAMPLVRALLGMNRYGPGSSASPPVEVVVLSRNSPETGVRVYNNIRSRGLPISRHAFTGGEATVDYLEAFDVDLFLTTNVEDAQRAIDAQACAAAVLKPPASSRCAPPANQVRIAFDGDGVLFDEGCELTARPDAPYAVLLRKLARLQERLPFGVEFSPLRIAVVTARSAPAEMQVINTLRHRGVHVSEIFSLGGLDKAKVVNAFRPHVVFDDQDLHLAAAARHVPATAGQPPEPPLLVETLVDELPDLAVSIEAR